LVRRGKDTTIMQQPFIIKNVAFGVGKPAVCVPVMEQDREEIFQKITELVKENVQMIEWRADWFRYVENEDAVRALLEEIRPLVENTVFLFTFRSRKQGGNSGLAEKKILRLNEIAAKSQAVDIIDLEFFEATFPLKEIRRFQKMGVKIIASHHDFDGTPAESIMRMLLTKMKEGNADIVKLAVMPQNTEDVLRLLAVTADMKKSYPGLPVVTMAMGNVGVISRICGETFGSCITFGAAGRTSAPGQINYKELETILELLHKNQEA